MLSFLANGVSKHAEWRLQPLLNLLQDVGCSTSKTNKMRASLKIRSDVLSNRSSISSGGCKCYLTFSRKESTGHQVINCLEVCDVEIRDTADSVDDGVVRSNAKTPKVLKTM